MDHAISRRNAFGLLGGALAVAAVPAQAFAAPGGRMVADALSDERGLLSGLAQKLAAAPRRRSFAKVPFMIDRAELWDHEASDVLLSYKGKWTQVWESSDLGAPWLNLMRESLNGQAFAHGHRDFLAVSATHGTAHLALFNQAVWEKYNLASNTGGKFTTNSFITERSGVDPTDDRQLLNGFYGAGNNNIVTLQRRGAVMVACHDSIHAIARGVAERSGGEADVIAADLTNNLIDGVILVPSVVAYLVELQRAGFTYAKAS